MRFAPQRCALLQHLKFQLTSKRVSHHSGVQFLISHTTRWLRTRRFVEPTFQSSKTTKHWKTTVFRDFSIFRPSSSFFCFSLLLHFLRRVLIYRTFRLSSTRWQQAPALCQGSCSILHTLCPPRCLRCLCPIRIKAFRPMVNTCQGTQWHGWWLFQDKFAYETKYASTCFARETVVVETCDKKNRKIMIIAIHNWCLCLYEHNCCELAEGSSPSQRQQFWPSEPSE